MTTLSDINVVVIDTGPPGPHSGSKILRVANVEGGSGNYQVTWRPICDLTEDERSRINCSLDFRDEHILDPLCDTTPPCTIFPEDTSTCCRSGNCGADDTIYTRYRTGETDRELIVTVDNIPQFAQNFGPDCQLIFHWIVTDVETGDTVDGCCGVVFRWRVITPQPLTITTAGCGTALLVDTSLTTPAASQIVRITNVTGGVGPYEITWEELTPQGSCVGTTTETYGDYSPYENNQITVNISNVPRFTTNNPSAPCVLRYKWTVRDLGVTNELGQLIGRVETGICTLSPDYQIVTPPELDITLIGCDDVTVIDTGPVGPHMAEAVLQVDDITGGSGNYQVVWSTVPTALSGSCQGAVTAEVSLVNDRLLTVTAANVPQFAENVGAECVRQYTAVVTDIDTGFSESVDCSAIFQYSPISAPSVVLTVLGDGDSTPVDTGSCSAALYGEQVLTITSITGGSGDYTIEWLPDSPPSTCGVGTFSTVESNDVGEGPLTLTVRLTSTSAASGSCTYTAIIRVTDNVTGVVTDTEVTAPFVVAATTVCPPLGVTTVGCGSTVTYLNSPSASGTTSYAHLTVTASGGSGSYALDWNTTPSAVTGTCYTQSVAESSPTPESRLLRVRLTGIGTSEDNVADPCERTYDWTVTDLVTGEVETGSCTVTFVVDLTTSDCSLGYGARTCGSTTVALTSTAPVTRTMSITGLSGGFPSGYEIDWELSTTCGGRAVFDATGTSTHTTTTAGTSTSAVIEFTAGPDEVGSCTVIATATVRSVDGLDERLYCGAPIECEYNVTWNTETAPSGTIVCPGGVGTITRSVPSITRTYSITGQVNTTSRSWTVTGCGALSVSPVSGSASSITVTYAASTAGLGINGTCNPVVTVTLTGPGGTTEYECNDTINYDTRPAAMTITGVTNCGQSATIPGTATVREHTFSTMTVSHSVGAGGPYVYEWTMTPSGSGCGGVVWTPTTAATASIVPHVAVPAGGGSCTATYQVRVRDSAGQWSAPTECDVLITYVAEALQMEIWDGSLGEVEVFNGFVSICKISPTTDGRSGWSDCTTTPTFTSCSSPSTNCAPSPGTIAGGASGDGDELYVRVTGGVPPYTIRIQNVTKTYGAFPGSQCAHWSPTGDGVINASTSFPTGILFSRTVPDSSDVYFAAIVGTCGSAIFEVGGMFDVVVADSDGNVTSPVTYPWSVRRVSGGIEP